MKTEAVEKTSTQPKEYPNRTPAAAQVSTVPGPTKAATTAEEVPSFKGEGVIGWRGLGGLGSSGGSLVSRFFCVPGGRRAFSVSYLFTMNLSQRQSHLSLIKTKVKFCKSDKLLSGWFLSQTKIVDYNNRVNPAARR